MIDGGPGHYGAQLAHRHHKKPLPNNDDKLSAQRLGLYLIFVGL